MFYYSQNRLNTDGFLETKENYNNNDLQKSINLNIGLFYSSFVSITNINATTPFFSTIFIWIRLTYRTRRTAKKVSSRFILGFLARKIPEFRYGKR